MAHARKQIRDAVKTALSGATAAGTNVFSHRSLNWEQSSLPCLNVTNGVERIENSSMGPANLRLGTVQVTAYLDGVANLDDQADALAVEIEPLVLASMPTSVKNVQLTSTTFETNGDTNRLIGAMVLSFEFTYRTAGSDPETFI